MGCGSDAGGGIFDRLLRNRVDPNRKWFQVGKVEQKLYEILKVKRWKSYLPTYDPDTFDKRQRTWGEIAGAMCQAELIHETIAALSFFADSGIDMVWRAAVRFDFCDDPAI